MKDDPNLVYNATGKKINDNHVDQLSTSKLFFLTVT